MRAAANKEVDAVGGRLVSVDLKKTVPGSKGRIAEVRKIVCLVAGDHPTRKGQSGHFGDDRFQRWECLRAPGARERDQRYRPGSPTAAASP